jgi:hypothetical protein
MDRYYDIDARIREVQRGRVAPHMQALHPVKQEAQAPRRLAPRGKDASARLVKRCCCC